MNLKYTAALLTLILMSAGLYYVWIERQGKSHHEVAATIYRAVVGDKKSATHEKPQKRETRKLRPGEPKPYYGELASIAAINVREAVLDKVVSGLAYPWAMEFLNKDELLVTLFKGELLRIHLPSGKKTLLSGMPELPKPKNQAGLLDVAIHPEFPENGLIFFSHAVEKTADGQPLYSTAVTRGKLQKDSLIELQQIVTAEPYASSPSNFGGALAFDPDGWLYVSIGDRSSPIFPQQLDVPQGKILRIDIHGNAHPQNPYIDQPNADARIFAIGVRNPQGLEFDPAGGGLFETEHGPMGGDEVNYIEAGKNYGWPTVTYGSNYTYEDIGVGTEMVGMQEPLFYYLPSIAISPITQYRGTMFAQWQGDLLVGALRGAHVNKLDWKDGAIRSEQRILEELKGRVRDIKVAEDGSIYFLVQNGGMIYRLHRDPTRTEAGVESKKKRNGKTVYSTVCSSCHSSKGPAMPVIGDTAEWSARLKSGKKALYQNAIEGKGAMPPKGFCEACTDEEIRRAVNYILSKSGVGK